MSQIHYVPKEISRVDSRDSKVCLTGKIAGLGNNSFILDDGTGRIEIMREGELDKGKLIRVFCSVIDERLSADALQSMEGFDLDLFKKVKELYNRAGV